MLFRSPHPPTATFSQWEGCKQPRIGNTIFSSHLPSLTACSPSERSGVSALSLGSESRIADFLYVFGRRGSAWGKAKERAEWTPTFGDLRVTPHSPGRRPRSGPCQRECETTNRNQCSQGKLREPGFGRGLGDGGRWAKAPRGGPPDPWTPPLPAPGALALSLPPLPPRQAPNSFGAFDVLFPLPGTSHPKSRGTPQSGWLLPDFNSKVKYHLQPPKLIFLHRIYRSLKSVYFPFLTQVCSEPAR